MFDRSQVLFFQNIYVQYSCILIVSFKTQCQDVDSHYKRKSTGEGETGTKEGMVLVGHVGLGDAKLLPPPPPPPVQDSWRTDAHNLAKAYKLGGCGTVDVIVAVVESAA